MGQQIIRQPDGRYAVWESIVEDFVLRDATVQQIITWRMTCATEDIERSVRETVAKLARGEKPYFQFTKTWEQALKWHREVHGGVKDCATCDMAARA